MGRVEGAPGENHFATRKVLGFGREGGGVEDVLWVGAVEGGAFHYFDADCAGLAAARRGVEQDFGGERFELDGQGVLGWVGEGGADVVVGTGTFAVLVGMGGHVEEGGHGVALGKVAEEVGVDEVGDVVGVLADELGDALRDFDGVGGIVLGPRGVAVGDC